jgi:hypothetical protein
MDIILNTVIASLATVLAGFVTVFMNRFSKNKNKEAEKIATEYANQKNEIDNKIQTQLQMLSMEKKNNQMKMIIDELYKSIQNGKANEFKQVSNLIVDYHEQALNQAKVQFWFSVIAASIGFLLIIINLFFTGSSNTNNNLLNTIPGIVIDAIAALFFKQANDTRKRATELFDRLRIDNQKEDAIKLAEKIENKEIKDLIFAQIAINTSGVNTSADDFKKIIELIGKSKAAINEQVGSK